MSATNDTTKVCSVCGVEKPLSDYYIFKSNQKYMRYCKKCHSSRANLRRPVDRCGVTHQNEFIQILHSRGIYASPGKSSEYTHADVVAWGCVRIEVKLGTHTNKHKPEQWAFHFTEKQINGGLVADLVALMCPENGGYTCYLIDPTCPEFYLDGKFRKSMTINTGTHHKNRRDGRKPLSSELLNSHRDNWQAIEQKRVEIARAYQQKALVSI